MNKKRVETEIVLLEGVGKHLFPLFLQSIEGTSGVFLKNTFYPPYKRPQLPFHGNTAKVHCLLRPLKIAHAYLVKEYLQFGSTLPGQYFSIDILYNIDALYDYWYDKHDIGPLYFEDRVHKPFLAEGFVIQDDKHNYLNYSFDLKPFYKEGNYEKYPGYDEIDLTRVHTESVKESADVYNDCICELFSAGYLLLPAQYVIPPLVKDSKTGEILVAGKFMERYGQLEI